MGKECEECGLAMTLDPQSIEFMRGDWWGHYVCQGCGEVWRVLDPDEIPKKTEKS